MMHPLKTHVFRGHAGLLQAQCVSFVVIYQGIKLGADDQGSRQAGKTRSQHGGCTPVQPISGVRHISRNEPVHGGSSQHVAGCVALIRCVLPAHIRTWINKNLQCNVKIARIVTYLCENRGKIAASAVTAYGNGPRINPQLGRTSRSPKCRRICVMYRSRKRGLGSQPIIHGQYGAIALDGEPATDGVVTIDAPEHPAATVEKNEQRATDAVVMRTVESCRDRPFATGYRYVINQPNLWRGR